MIFNVVTRLSLALLFLACATMTCTAAIASTDRYRAVQIECKYITLCSMSPANPTVKHVDIASPGYGALNSWRIGNGHADWLDCGIQGIGSVGLLYGYHRLKISGHSNPDLDRSVGTTLRGFFQHWLTNPVNRQTANRGVAFPGNIAYNAAGQITQKTQANVPATAQLLIAMRKYCELSPFGDGRSYQSQEYAQAHGMADFVDANLGSWTVDRSYAVAAFRSFSGWARAVGDTKTADYYDLKAQALVELLAAAQDRGPWRNYYDYLDGGGHGVYNGGSVDQTGFAPYEFNARSAAEPYAAQVADWWDHGQAVNRLTLSVQSGAWSGGVHQTLPSNPDRAYPGDSFQLADAEWKIAHATGGRGLSYARALWHYNFALSPVGSRTGSGCWVVDGATDGGFAGGFIDWVSTRTGQRPATWQRYVDTSGYMLIATEEVVFGNEVDWSR